MLFSKGNDKLISRHILIYCTLKDILNLSQVSKLLNAACNK